MALAIKSVNKVCERSLNMKRRIYLNMLILTTLSVILASVFLIMTFYKNFADQVKSELKNQAKIFETTLNIESNQDGYLEQLHLEDSDIRITLVGVDGTVLYDNTFTDESVLENHAQREEILEAIKNGFGEEERLSKTFGTETYYYAIRLENGNIIRTAKTTSSAFGVLAHVLPQSILIVMVILLACLVLASRLTKKIVSPINSFSFDENSETYDELSPFIRTITTQKEQIVTALNEVTKKSTVIDAITGNMNEGLILTNKYGMVLSANKSAATILGVKRINVDENILLITRNVAILKNMEMALSDKNNDLVLEIDSRTYHIVFSSVDNGVLILFLDITEKEKSEKMRREFTANVSHELRTPLTTISGYAELMANGMVQPEDITSVSEKMKNESDRLLALIEDIMRLSELDEDDKVKDFAWFDLTDLISEVADNLKVKAQKNNTTINIPKEQYTINASRPMIYELIYNLIDNAIKYNKQDGSVTAMVSQNDGITTISVKDTGIGIDKKHHERIFERFYRVDKSRSKKIGGTGLGLSIVKHIVIYHKGNIKVESEAGLGTKVDITL